MHLRNRIGFPFLSILVASSLLLAGPALANPRVKPGGETLSMIGYVIDDIDVGAGTLTVGGETYLVTSTSQLVDATGQRIGLRDLRGSDSHGVADLVKLTTRRSGAGGRAEIRELRIVDLGQP